MAKGKKPNQNDFTAPADPFKTPDFAERDLNDTNSDDNDNNSLDNLIETGSITVDNDGHYIHCLTIIGQIEGHYTLPSQNKTTKYEHVIPRLVAIEESEEIEGLIIILNTVGGDIEAGLAIAELIAGMRTPTVSLVLGGGHSIGVPLAVSAKHSFITPSATMTIHPVRLNGLIIGVPQTFSYFDKMQERIIRFISNNSKITPEKFREYMMKTGELIMDVGSVLDGETAVKEGLIDSIGSLSDALNCLYEMIETNPKEKRSKSSKRRKSSDKKEKDKKEKNKKSDQLKESVEKTEKALEYRKQKEQQEEI